MLVVEVVCARRGIQSVVGEVVVVDLVVVSLLLFLQLLRLLLTLLLVVTMVKTATRTRILSLRCASPAVLVSWLLIDRLCRLCTVLEVVWVSPPLLAPPQLDSRTT